MTEIKRYRKGQKVVIASLVLIALVLIAGGAYLLRSQASQGFHNMKAIHSDKGSETIQQSASPQSQEESKTGQSSPSTSAIWNAEKASKLSAYMVDFGKQMNQESYVHLVPYGDNDFGGAMSFAEQNRIMVGEKESPDSPMTNKQKVDVAFSEDGSGSADYLIVDSYGYINDFILYHFTIHDGQPVVLVSQQSQGNPERMYYMYPSNNEELQRAFADIVNNP